jgi:Fe-S-cluster containining protein
MTDQELILIEKTTGKRLDREMIGKNRFRVPMDVCPFLLQTSKSGICSIYAIRPCQCRMFHCGRRKKEDPFLHTLREVGDLMIRDPKYAYWKGRMEAQAASWGNARGWSWRKAI